MINDFINQILVYLTVVAQVFLLLSLVLYQFNDGRKAFEVIVRKHGLWLAFLVALVATGGSLFYSEIMGYNPCKLCWYQRVFMYSQVFILGLALQRKEITAFAYSYLLLGVGMIISLYHNYIYYNASLVCGIDSGDCSERFNLELGYMSIPLMALTAFLLISFLLYGYQKLSFNA